jgi:ABC-2 type transport system ATP-binding protein
VTETAISAEALTRRFEKGPLAVDGIDLDVRRGEIYGFLGPNGAGKSTTVHMLVTLLPPTSGSATVAGHDVVRHPDRVRGAIGAALQEAALDPYLNAWDHMRLQGSLHGLPRSDRERRSAELIDRVGLAGAAERRVGGYSGGMKRRLDLALALLHAPQVLFLDEPTTGLDPQSRAALWEEVARLAREDGVTVFLTTQYLEEADQLADRVGIISGGAIVAEDTPAALKAEVGEPRLEVTVSDPGERARAEEVLARFGSPVEAAREGAVAIRLRRADAGQSALAAVVLGLDGAGIGVSDVSAFEPTLDDVFLDKTGKHLEGGEGEPAAGVAPPAKRRRFGRVRS